LSAGIPKFVILFVVFSFSVLL